MNARICSPLFRSELPVVFARPCRRIPCGTFSPPGLRTLPPPVVSSTLRRSSISTCSTPASAAWMRSVSSGSFEHGERIELPQIAHQALDVARGVRVVAHLLLELLQALHGVAIGLLELLRVAPGLAVILAVHRLPYAVVAAVRSPSRDRSGRAEPPCGPGCPGRLAGRPAAAPCCPPWPCWPC